MKIRIGTRKSELAMFQANYVAGKLIDNGIEIEIVPIISEGDIREGPLHEIGGKGLFVNKLEEALSANEIDCAVHSLKDVPAKIDNRFIINAVMPRESYEDILVKNSDVELSMMPTGSIVGTSSPRRSAQILNKYPNLIIKPIRGNISTRLSKLRNENYDAILIAEAAINRLEIGCKYISRFHIKEMLPAASQGYIGIQCLNTDNEISRAVSNINSSIDMALANAERVFVAQLNGSCTSPICILCEYKNNIVNIHAKVLSLDGKKQISKTTTADLSNLNQTILSLSKEFIDDGARSLIL